MQCPKCKHSQMWDNRSKKASGEFSPKSPDFSCKDKSCGHAIWPPRPGESESIEHESGGFRDAQGMEHQARYARQVFEKAWSESGEVMKTLMPEKDAANLSVAEWYDLKLRIAQFIAIQTQRNL